MEDTPRVGLVLEAKVAAALEARTLSQPYNEVAAGAHVVLVVAHGRESANLAEGVREEAGLGSRTIARVGCWPPGWFARCLCRKLLVLKWLAPR